MKQNWWKIATVLLLLFTVVYSLITWLQPGIASVSNEELKSVDNKITITGYNTDFTLTNESFEKPVVFLYKQNSDEGFCVSDVTVIDKAHLKINFNLPPDYSGLLDLTVYYAEDALIFPSA